jgi:hypothetical protein
LKIVLNRKNKTRDCKRKQKTKENRKEKKKEKNMQNRLTGPAHTARGGVQRGAGANLVSI